MAERLNAAVLKTVEGNTSGGSNPSLPASLLKHPIKPTLYQLRKEIFTTSLQLLRNFLYSNTKHLQKIGSTYYFVFKVNGSIVKQTLRTDNLLFANLLKIKLYGSHPMLKKLDPNLTFNKIQVDEGDNPEDIALIQELNDKIERILMGKKQQKKISNVRIIDSDEIKPITLKEAFTMFMAYKKDTENKSDDTIKKINNVYRYLLLFAHESTDIHQINKKKFFNTLQSNLKQLPSNIFKFKQFEGKTFDEIMKFKDEKEKQAFNQFPKLTNKTINNMFVYIKNLIEYLERNDYIKTNNMKIKYLEEAMSDKTQFDDNELGELLNYKDETIRNMFKVFVYTGLRRKELIELKKTDILYEDNIPYFNIEESGERTLKTKNSTRRVPIHPDILELVKYQLAHNDTEFLFFNGEDNQIGKRLNRAIKSVLTPENQELKSLHSFRKNFTQKLDDVEAPSDIIKKLVGHSLNDDITETHYKTQTKIEILYKHLSKISFDFSEDTSKNQSAIQ